MVSIYSQMIDEGTPWHTGSSDALAYIGLVREVQLHIAKRGVILYKERN